jgi:polyphosphate kinase 2 (PPK2 family)
MVERIEGFCTEEEWKRAFREINQFERKLVDFGTILVKFWIHISPEEQLARFEARKDAAYKAWKLTDEDWRNRQKWDAYAEAVEDMLLKTSTITAPWTIVEGNSKYYARVKAVKTIVDTLERELEPFDVTAPWLPVADAPLHQQEEKQKEKAKKKKNKKKRKKGKKKKKSDGG